MSLKSDCKDAIYFYAPLEMQLNAAHLGEKHGDVWRTVTALRARYQVLKAAGEDWSIDPQTLSVITGISE